MYFNRYSNLNTFTRSIQTSFMTEIFIATPTYDSQVSTQYCISINENILNLVSQRINVQFVPHLSSTLLVLARNTLVECFLETKATHLMFIDSDLGFQPDAILRLLKADKDIVCGVYPARKEKGLFVYNPQRDSYGAFISDPEKKHLIKADMTPCGFMLLKREAIVKMVKAYKHLRYAPGKDEPGDKGTLLFNTDVIDGRFHSEDYVFCKRATNIGLDIWVDPLIQFNHAGVVASMTVLPEIKQFLGTQQISM